MIIIGYPGIGKTYASTQFVDVIDFDCASILGYDEYCKMAEILSKQNYIVCVSSHKEVQDYFTKSTEMVYVCYPELDLEIPWAISLRRRYMQDPTDKNLAAYRRAISYFDSDIKDMMSSGFEQIELGKDTYLSDIIQDSINNRNNQIANEETNSSEEIENDNISEEIEDDNIEKE